MEYASRRDSSRIPDSGDRLEPLLPLEDDEGDDGEEDDEGEDDREGVFVTR